LAESLINGADQQLQSLVGDVEVDLDAALSADDE